MAESSVRAVAQDQLEHCRRLAELGDTSALVQAVRLCTFGGLPLPDWLSEHVEAAMLFYFREGGADGKGKTGGNVARFRRQRVHRKRHQIASREIARGGSKAAAFDRASKELAGTEARGEPRAIAASYRMIEAIFARLKEPN